MNDQEYSDGYAAEHPELIPGNGAEANIWIEAALAAGVPECDTQTFLKAWWAFAWLHPGFHPDDFRQSEEHPYAQELTAEAFHRNHTGEIGDDVLYASEAAHNAVWLEIRRNQHAATCPPATARPNIPG
jgi:hypothetical protein